MTVIRRIMVDRAKVPFGSEGDGLAALSVTSTVVFVQIDETYRVRIARTRGAMASTPKCWRTPRRVRSYVPSREVFLNPPGHRKVPAQPRPN